MKNRIIALLLVFCLSISLLPVTAFADEAETPATVTTEEQAPAETTSPVKETEAPVKETEAPVKETEAPVKETEAPAKETEAPAEETEASATETEAPAEETPAPPVMAAAAPAAPATAEEHVHTVSFAKGSAATCTKYGYKDAYICGCGQLFTDAAATIPTSWAELKIPAGHRMTLAKGHDATCTEDGLKDAYICSACGGMFADASGSATVTWADLKIKAEGHKISAANGRVATCTEPGYEDAFICTTCKQLYSDAAGQNPITWNDVKIPATGHNVKLAKGKAATCTEAGYKDAYTCMTCKAVFEDPAGNTPTSWDAIKIPAKGHDMTFAKGHEATCTEGGYKDSYLCKTCKAMFEDEAGNIPTTWDAIKIPAKGHDMTLAKGHEATCTEGGYKDSYLCKTCKAMFEDEAGNIPTTWDAIKIPAKGHDINPAKGHDPSCTEDGYEDAFICMTCKQLFSDEAGNTPITWDDIKIPATGHDIKPAKGHPATCTEDGYKDAFMCMDCKQLFADADGKQPITWDDIKIPAGHKNVVPAKGHPATCTEDGYEDAYVCMDCKQLFADADGKQPITWDDIKIPAGHKNVVPAKGHDASCTEDGYEDAYVCMDCKQLFADADGKQPITWDDIIIPAGHKNIKPAKGHDASCTEDGYEDAYVCMDCKQLFADAEGKQPITWDDIIIPAGHKNIKPAKGHPATCTEDGYEDAYVCMDCKQLFADAEGKQPITWDDIKIPAGHKNIKPAKGHPATCTEDGYEDAYVCMDCKQLFADAEGKQPITWDDIKIPAGHKNVVPAKGHAPTCTEDGYENCYVCLDCKALFLDAEATKPTTWDDIKIPATGHKYEGWESTSRKHWQECTVCGHETEHEHHNWVKNAKKSTATKTHYDCDVCGRVKVVDTSKWDWDNPKTGDYIMISVSVMLIAGAALAFMAIWNAKRKKN